MWVTKLLISPVKIRIFCPRTTKFGPKLAFLFIWARPCQLIWCPVGGLVGGCGARAVSRKTPIYFIGLSCLAALQKSRNIQISLLYRFHHQIEDGQFQGDVHRQVDVQEQLLAILNASFSPPTPQPIQWKLKHAIGRQDLNMWGARNLQVYVLGDARVL